MIIEENFLSKLKDVGLNSYEAKIWTALLSRGVATAGELSDIANVPRSRSYDVLESLEKKGFIIMKVGKPIKYIAVSPSEVIERVKKKIHNDTESQLKMLEELQDSNVFNELSMLHTQGVEATDPSELSGSFKGRDSIHNHLEAQIKKARESIVLMTTAQGLERKYKNIGKQLKKASRNGVKLKIAAPITKENYSYAKELAKFAEVKHIDSPGRLLVVDKEDLSCMLLDDAEVHSAYDTAVWMKSPIFTNTFLNMLNNSWDKLEDVE